MYAVRGHDKTFNIVNENFLRHSIKKSIQLIKKKINCKVELIKRSQNNAKKKKSQSIV